MAEPNNGNHRENLLSSSGKHGIEVGMHILVQRGDQERIIEFKSNDSITFGKGNTQQNVELQNALGKPNYSKFRVVLKENSKADTRSANFTLVELSDDEKILTTAGDNAARGKDNRDILDDNKAQRMSALDIQELKERGASGSEILENLISNSASFSKKTEYSQEKYLKKKEKMYGDTITFIKPTLSLLADYYFKKDPSKILNLRADTLSQLLSYATVSSGGKFLIYETGCSGLVVAAVLTRLNGEGLVLHVHPGSSPQRQAINLLNFTTQQLQPLRSLDVFYLVRQSQDSGTGKREPSSGGNILEEESPAKKLKTENGAKDCETAGTTLGKAAASVNRVENEKSVGILESTLFSGLIIAGKEHPLSILQRLLPRLAPSASFAIFSPLAEPLGECYMWLKEKNKAVNIHLAENWYRNIQVETERTHPEINMSSSGGFFLTGTAIL